MTAITASPRWRQPGCHQSAAVAAWAQQSRGRSSRDAGPTGNPLPKTLRDGHDVGRDTLVHMDQPAAAAAHSGLHLIHPQQGAMLIADLPGLREVTLGRHHNAVLALDRLEHDGRYRVVHHGGQCFSVAVRDEDHLAGQRLEGYAVLRIVSESERPWSVHETHPRSR